MDRWPIRQIFSQIIGELFPCAGFRQRAVLRTRQFGEPFLSIFGADALRRPQEPDRADSIPRPRRFRSIAPTSVATRLLASACFTNCSGPFAVRVYSPRVLRSPKPSSVCSIRRSETKTFPRAAAVALGAAAALEVTLAFPLLSALKLLSVLG